MNVRGFAPTNRGSPARQGEGRPFVKRRFRLTPEATADLRDILLDIAEDNPDTAERLRSEVYEVLQQLGEFPRASATIMRSF